MPPWLRHPRMVARTASRNPGEGRSPRRSPDASVMLPSIPRRVPSALRGHRHPRAQGRRAFLRMESEPDTSSSGVGCVTA